MQYVKCIIKNLFIPFLIISNPAFGHLLFLINPPSSSINATASAMFIIFFFINCLNNINHFTFSFEKTSSYGVFDFFLAMSVISIILHAITISTAIILFNLSAVVCLCFSFGYPDKDFIWIYRIF